MIERHEDFNNGVERNGIASQSSHILRNIVNLAKLIVLI